MPSVINRWHGIDESRFKHLTCSLRFHTNGGFHPIKPGTSKPRWFISWNIPWFEMDDCGLPPWLWKPPHAILCSSLCKFPEGGPSSYFIDIKWFFTIKWLGIYVQWAESRCSWVITRLFAAKLEGHNLWRIRRCCCCRLCRCREALASTAWCHEKVQKGPKSLEDVLQNTIYIYYVSYIYI